MASVSERIERVLEREAPAWGIRSIPTERRILNGLDLAVLWGDLSVGLLVMVTGALLVPALGLSQALLAIAVGSVIGCVPLALVALAGQREAVPTMVLFRPVLGERGSFLPTALNVLQLVGWTAVEFWAIGEVANVASDRLFGIYVLIATAVWITVGVLGETDLGRLWGRAGDGGLPFWLAVDLVIVMPISWLPLAADYTRFAKPGSRAVAGTYVGYLIGNVWFYALGVLIALAAGETPDVAGIGTSIVILAGGGVVLLALLVGESDNAFADIYSAAVSTQNAAPNVSQRALVGIVGAISFILALAFTMERYEFFLFLIGSVFVPLFGVFAADYFVPARGRYGEATLFERTGVHARALVPWIAGFVLFHWCVPTGPQAWTDAVETVFAEWLSLPFPLFDSRLGASLPSFAVAFALALALALPNRRPATR